MQDIKLFFFGLTFVSFLAGCTPQTSNLNSTDLSLAEKIKPEVTSVTNTIPTQCSAELLRPAIFREEPLKVLVYDSSAKFLNIPTEMVWSETKIQVEPARHVEETEPAQYEEFEEIIEVERARSELYATSAQYQKVIREIVTKPAYKHWKEGCLPDTHNSCIEEVAATLSKIPTEIIQVPAQIHQRYIPTKTLKIKRKKLLKAGTGRGGILPARYETVKVWRVSKPWKIISSLVPAQYQTLTTQRKLRDERIIAMPVACLNSLTSQRISQIQQALLNNGQNLVISGSLDTATLLALHAFQAANQLAIGGISLETLRKLGLA